MHVNPLFEYPELNRVTLPSGSRYYVCPDTGKKLPSVTTILSATSSKSFEEWEARVGKRKADQERKYGTDLGSLVHEHMERHILNEERRRGTNFIHVEARRMADAMIDKGMGPVGELWGIETPLFYPELYAGTTDLIGLYNGIPSVMDFKTAKRLRKREDIDDYRDQLAAYMMAHNERYGTNLVQGVILMVARDLQFEAFVYTPEQMKVGCDAFLNRVAKFYAGFEGFA